MIGEGSAARTIARLRRGDIFGEMGLLTDEPRSATILPTMPVQVRELDRTSFTDIIHRLSGYSSEHLPRPREASKAIIALPRPIEAQRVHPVPDRARDREAGAGHHCRLPANIAARHVGRGPVCFASLGQDRSLERNGRFGDGSFRPVGRHLREPSSACRYCDQQEIASLIQYVDRVALLGTEADMHEVSNACAESRSTVEVFRVGPSGSSGIARAGSFRTVRTLHEDDVADNAGWIARHLTRTKLGLALGAGGAKGFAHVGVIDALQRAGYTIDFVAGSSIGALVGALMGLRIECQTRSRGSSSISGRRSMSSCCPICRPMDSLLAWNAFSRRSKTVSATAQ